MTARANLSASFAAELNLSEWRMGKGIAEPDASKRKRRKSGDPHPVSVRFTWVHLDLADELCVELTKRAFADMSVSRTALLREACIRGLKSIEREVKTMQRAERKWSAVMREEMGEGE